MRNDIGYSGTRLLDEDVCAGCKEERKLPLSIYGRKCFDALKKRNEKIMDSNKITDINRKMFSK